MLSLCRPFSDFEHLFGILEVCCAHFAGQSAISPLWGIQGESFKPDGYISKGWAKAGYRGGQQPPLLPVLTDLKQDWGAVGDGIHDDTEVQGCQCGCSVQST